MLSYLKCCAASVVADDQRSHLRWACEEPLSTIEREPLARDPAESVIEELAAHDLWQTVRSAARNEAERLVLEENLLHGVPPRSLPHHYPQVFATTADVYRVKRNLLERLRRNRAVQAWRRE